LEVDEFVDEVEESFAQLLEENSSLKKQVEALKSSSTQTAPQPAVRAPAASTPAAPAAPAAQETTVRPDAIVVTTSKEASSAVVRLVEMATEQAERLVADSDEDAKRIREEANRTAHQLTTDARTRAERVESEARVHAERLQADALSRAEKLDREIESRRAEMFGTLEKQREDLTATVSALRNFEATYRSNLTQHLRSQIETLESDHLEPGDPPEEVRNLPAGQANATVGNGSGPDPSDGAPESQDAADQPEGDDKPAASGGAPTSNTPRLDALLGDQR
jgi:cell division septum initiation protein DivIVA